MKDIFRLLLFRMRKEALGYIVLGLIAVFNAVLALILGLIHLDNPEAGVYLGEFMDFSFSPFYVILGTVASFNPLILIIMGYVALFIGKEWRQRTFRNFLLAGKSRMSIYLSFYLFGILAALGLVLVGQIFYWPIGLAFGVSFRPADSEAILYLIKFAVNLIAYLTFVSMAIGIVFLVPNGWATIGISYGFFTVITLIPTLIQIIFALTNTPLNPNEPWNFIFLYNILAALCKTVPHTYTNDGGTPIYFYQTGNFPIAMAFYWLHVAVLGVGVPVLGSLTFLKRDIR